MKKLISLLLALTMALSLTHIALAKTSSDPIDAPSSDTIALTVDAGGMNLLIRYGDISDKDGANMETHEYPAKVDGVQTTKAWTGIMLKGLLLDLRDLGAKFTDETEIKAIAADGYEAAFTVADVMDESNLFMIAPDPVRNYDGDKDYGASYVRILRAADASNQANIRCVTGIRIDSPEPSKKAGGDVENAVFYIAVKETADSPIVYYYYTLDEIKAYGDEATFDYNDHGMQKKVTARGALITSLLIDLADSDIKENMIVQYAESDGYHADAATPVDESEYKEKVFWLSYDHVNAGGETEPPLSSMISYEIMEKYDAPDENNVNDAEFKDADNHSGYLRAYRQKDGANSAVIKYLMGIIVSEDGALFTGNDGYQVKALSKKNEGVAIAEYSAVTGLVPGMQYAIKAPEVNNATLSEGEPAVQVVTAAQGADSIIATFTYDEGAYLTVNGTQYVYTDFLSSDKSAQTPTKEEGEKLMESAQGVSYGYYDTMLYRYNGIWLSDLLGEAAGDVSLTDMNGKTVTVPAADAAKCFVAYNNTQSKSSTNVPEQKRVTKTYAAPTVIIPADGVAVTANGASELIGDKGAMVTIVMENVASIASK